MTKSRRQWLVAMLAVLLGGAAVPVAQGQHRPRLSVELIPQTSFQGEDWEQAVKINEELSRLKEHLPEVDVDVGRWPSDDFDYRLSRLVMDNGPDRLTLTARYEAPGGFSDELKGQFDEPCTEALAELDQCTRASLEARATHVVADLLDQTLVHWENGIYRPFSVLTCHRVTLQDLRLRLSYTSDVLQHLEPSSWFEYHPSVIRQVGTFSYPEPLELVLRRRTKEPDDAFIFVRRSGPDELFKNLCATEGDWVLAHQYPESTLQPSRRGSLPVAINSATPPVARQP